MRALRCSVDEKVKFFHVYFVGQSVSAMKKGKASLSKQASWWRRMESFYFPLVWLSILTTL
jgi:hypothetical protein